MTSEELRIVEAGILAVGGVSRFTAPKVPGWNRPAALSACGRARLRPNVVFESGQFTTILAMVGGGTGVSVVPQMAVERRKGCRFIPIADEGAYRRLGDCAAQAAFPKSRTQDISAALAAECGGMS